MSGVARSIKNSKGSLWAPAKFFLYHLDAESAHLSVVKLLKSMHDVPNFISKPFFRLLAGDLPLEQQIVFCNRKMSSQVGLAAGFDKNCEILPVLPKLGFGFAEIGTVTPLPQPGNPRPRMFRDVENQSLFNRMGFNNDGALEISKRLEKSRQDLPSSFVVGVNVGKNKDTPADQAHLDYEKAVKPFEGLADYLVINISSPNTPGLRDLQDTESVKSIVCQTLKEVSSWKEEVPVFLKLAPELSDLQIESLVKVGEENGIKGWIFTNTLGGTFKNQGKTLTGGWSGMPLREISLIKLKHVRTLTRNPVISVGGIMTPLDARERIEAGADLVQIYSGWIFNGPRFPFQIQKHLKN